MNDMKCIECVQKHLALALSYGKEVMSGHDEKNDLDHRIDFLGELGNAEHHLELIDKNLFFEINEFRQSIQNNSIKVTFDDLEKIRSLFKKVERINYTDEEVEEKILVEENVDIIFDEVKNEEYFEFAYKSIKEKLKNFNKIYVTFSNIDLSKYGDVEILNKDIFDIVKDDKITQSFIYTYENMIFLKNVDARAIIPTYSSLKKEMFKVIPYLRMNAITNKNIYSFDGVKPQLINKSRFNLYFDKIKNAGIAPLTCYFYFTNDENWKHDSLTSVEITKKICCSTKRDVKIKRFLRWTNEGFTHYKDYLIQK